MKWSKRRPSRAGWRSPGGDQQQQKQTRSRQQKSRRQRQRDRQRLQAFHERQQLVEALPFSRVADLELLQTLQPLVAVCQELNHFKAVNHVVHTPEGPQYSHVSTHSVNSSDHLAEISSLKAEITCSDKEVSLNTLQKEYDIQTTAMSNLVSIMNSSASKKQEAEQQLSAVREENSKTNCF